MGSTALEPVLAAPAVGQPGRVGQGTAVEQSRAIAEVQAAIIVARQFPRNVQGAIRQMEDACGQWSLAERAFYRYPRAGQTVTGASVHLARELARCYGNLQYGLTELRRDDEAAQSEMLVYAWDVETNTRSSHTFIVPHKRDKAGGPVVLTDMRDIYEANTNAAARRVREAIFAILPQWFVEDAKALCNKTLAEGGGVPLPKRIAAAIENFAKLGVTERQLADKLGRDTAEWTPQDVAQLGVIFTSLRNGETSRDEEFPQERVTTAEVLKTQPAGNGNPREQAPRAPAAAVQVAEPPPESDGPRNQGPRGAVPDGSGQITGRQLKDIDRHRNRLGFENHEIEEWLAYVASAAGLQAAHLADGVGALTQEQAKAALAIIGAAKDRPTLVQALTSQNSGADADSGTDGALWPDAPPEEGR